ncbi:GNAT family N-acetyltransferase [Streptomyces sp. NPDC127166]|uniref:GNAT family N-acetyltransferase n=1 Tax=Streptomyces sp. NPDC127166 TaxID=3345380 RepID=UPI003625A23C
MSNEALVEPCGPTLVVPLGAEHADEVVAVYRAGVDEGNATFETAAPGREQFDAAKLPEHRFAAVDGTGRVLGGVAVTKVSARCAYAGVVEHSVYVHPDARGRGVASALLDALVASTEAVGIWAIQAGTFPENAAGLAVHARAGLRVVGTRERIARHHGVWSDTVPVERRSPRVD